MKLMMCMMFALLIVPASFAYGSGDKGAMVAAGQGAGAPAKKYPLLSQHAVYQEWFCARTPKEKAEALNSYIPSYNYNPAFIGTEYIPRITCDPSICKNSKDRIAFFDEFERFLKENEKILSERDYSLLAKALQRDKQEEVEAQKKHAARHSMPEDLEQALSDGDAKLVFAHLDQKPNDIAAVDEEGNNPLMRALAQEKWNVLMIEQLIKKTKSLNLKNDEGEVALHQAARSNNPEAPKIIKLLVSAGANPHARDARDNMPIVDAVMAGSIANTRALLTYKISLDKVMHPGHPIMVTAIRPLPDSEFFVLPKVTEKEQIELIDTLAKHGADMNVTDTYSRTPLTAAIRYINEPVVRFLLDHKVDIAPDAIHDAMNSYSHSEEKDKERSLAIIKLLLEHGANPQGAYAQWPAIMNAATNGDLPVVKLLVDHGANIQYRYNGETPLDYVRRLSTHAGTSKDQKKKLKDTIEYLEKISPAHKASQGAKEHAQAAKELAQVPQEVRSLLGEFTAGPTHPDKITLNKIKKALMGDHKGQMGNYDPEFNKIVQADIDVLELQDEAGDTPLLLAIKYNKPDAVSIILALVESMPDATAKQKLLRVITSHENAQKFNGYRLAQELGYKDIVAMLAQYEK